MKLDSVRSYVVRNPKPCIGGKYLFFIKLQTDDGLVGWGESAVLGCYVDVWKAYDPVVQGIFHARVEGRSAFDREAIAKDIYDTLCNSRPDMFGAGIISAFDIALWDIVGKHCNLPISDLLGGKTRNSVRAYSYIYPKLARGQDALEHSMQDTLEWFDPEKLAISAREMVEQEGFTALKYDPLPTPGRTGRHDTPWSLSNQDFRTMELTLSAVRDAVGDDVDILIGTHGQTTTAAARDIARVFEKYHVRWFEEPVPCENRREMGRVASFTSIPVASGERLTGIHEFHQLFDEHAVAYAQPDLGACGGITAAKKIAALAEAHYVQMAPHVWGGPIILAAALQLDLTIPNFFIQESTFRPNTFHDFVLDEPIRMKDGYLIPNGRPGLGHNLVESELEKHLA